MYQENNSVDCELWKLFGEVDKSLIEKVVVLHVFGETAESALFVTNEDVVYAIGANNWCNLGIGEKTHTTVPLEISELRKKRIKYFVSTLNRTLALTEDGECWCTGRNFHGSIYKRFICCNDILRNYLSRKMKIRINSAIYIYAASCGFSFSVILSNYGLHQFTSQSHFENSVEIEGMAVCILEPVVDIVCGGFHTAALTSKGNVYVWGEAHSQTSSGQLMSDAPKQLALPPVKYIGCGLFSTLCLTEKGALLMAQNERAEVIASDIQAFAVSYVDNFVCMKYKGDSLYSFYISDMEKLTFSLPSLVPVTNMQSAFGGRVTPRFPKKLPVKCSYVKLQQNEYFRMLFNNKDHSDFTVKLKSGDVYTHKMILMKTCEHFKSILECNESSFYDMTCFRTESCLIFFKYIYEGWIYFDSFDDLFGLYDIADVFGDDELRCIIIGLIEQMSGSLHMPDIPSSKKITGNIKQPIKLKNRDFSILLLDDKEHSDLTLELFDGVVYVHKCILAATSSFFQSLLSGQWAESNANVLDMTKYEPKAYRFLLKYLYNGTVYTSDLVDLIHLYELADFCLQTDLMNSLSPLIKGSIRVNNILQMFCLAEKFPHFNSMCIHFTEFYLKVLWQHNINTDNPFMLQINRMKFQRRLSNLREFLSYISSNNKSLN